MKIVPALYIKDGKLAAYKPGNYEDIEFLDKDPYEFIDMLCKLPINQIRLIDVDASIGSKSNAGLLGSLSSTTVSLLEVGGGINNMDYLKSLQYAGVDYFIVGTAIFDDPEFLKAISEADDVKNDRILISIDIMDGKIKYHGWKDDAPESFGRIIEEIRDMGFTRFFITDMTTDTENEGPDLDFYRALVEEFPDCLFGAAGRIETLEDVYNLKEVGVDEVVVGNKIYKEKSLLERIAKFNKMEE